MRQANKLLSKYCSASSNYAASKDAYRQYIETISPNAYGAYEQCLALTEQDLKFNVNFANILPAQFTLTVSFAATVAGSDTAQLAYSTSAGISCDWDGSTEKVRKIVSPSSTFLNCARKDQSAPGFVTVARIDSTSAPLTIPWQAYSKEGVQLNNLNSLQKVIDQLQLNLASNTAALASITGAKTIPVCRFSEPLDPAGPEILKTFPPAGVRISQNLSPL